MQPCTHSVHFRRRGLYIKYSGETGSSFALECLRCWKHEVTVLCIWQGGVMPADWEPSTAPSPEQPGFGTAGSTRLTAPGEEKVGMAREVWGSLPKCRCCHL